MVTVYLLISIWVDTLFIAPRIVYLDMFFSPWIYPVVILNVNVTMIVIFKRYVAEVTTT